jgi:two-component system OmpR family response regulator
MCRANIWAWSRRATWGNCWRPATSRWRRLRFSGWRLDLLRRELSNPLGEPVTLSNGEFNLLRAFAESPGRILTRDQLLERARGAEADVFDRAMDVQISRLRKKLDDGSGRDLIVTHRGEGYLFDARVERR